MPKRKLKPMTTDIDTANLLRSVFGDKIYNNLTIINNKIFTTTAKEVKKNGKQNDSNI